MASNSRKWKWGLIWVLVLALLIIWIIPYSLMKITKPDETKESSYFIDTYEESQNRFLTYEDQLKQHWQKTSHTEYGIGHENLMVDTIFAEANKEKENLILLTSAIHGIEGYVGSAMLDVFQSSILQELNPDSTAIQYVHAVNPWGMKHFRRYNEDNVDLNRNFIYDWDTFDLKSNQDYIDLADFYEKDHSVGNSTMHELEFLGSVAKEAVVSGTDKIEKALLTGQYTHPSGVYYGGKEDTKSTEILKGIFKEALGKGYKNVIHIDLHTGYGPRYQMSIFSAVSETMTQDEAVKAFNYPLVLTPESDGFYITKGDNTDYIYQLQQKDYQQVNLYSTTFEFGTLGTNMVGSIKSLRNTIDENRLYSYGTDSKWTEEKIKNRYLEMFYPSEQKWRDKAVEDFKQGLTGILTNHQVIQ